MPDYWSNKRLKKKPQLFQRALPPVKREKELPSTSKCSLCGSSYCASRRRFLPVRTREVRGPRRWLFARAASGRPGSRSASRSASTALSDHLERAVKRFLVNDKGARNNCGKVHSTREMPVCTSLTFHECFFFSRKLPSSGASLTKVFLSARTQLVGVECACCNHW